SFVGQAHAREFHRGFGLGGRPEESEWLCLKRAACPRSRAAAQKVGVSRCKAPCKKGFSMDDRTPESGDSRLDQLQRLTVRMSDSMRTDIVLYHGAITQRRLEGHFIGLCRALASAPNVLLVIATSASSADAAQWMGRFLRESYEKVTVYADNSRGSTGALLA